MARLTRAGWWSRGAARLLAVMAIFGDNGVLALRRLRGEVDTLRPRGAPLETENERLSRAELELQEDPAVIERIAREELGPLVRGPRSAGAALPAKFLRYRGASIPAPARVTSVALSDASAASFRGALMRWTWSAPYSGWFFAASSCSTCVRPGSSRSRGWRACSRRFRLLSGRAARAKMHDEEESRAQAGAPMFLTFVARVPGAGGDRRDVGAVPRSPVPGRAARAVRRPSRRRRPRTLPRTRDAGEHGRLCPAGHRGSAAVQRTRPPGAPSGGWTQQLNWGLAQALARVLEGARSRSITGVRPDRRGLRTRSDTLPCGSPTRSSPPTGGSPTRG